VLLDEHRRTVAGTQCVLGDDLALPIQYQQVRAA